MGKRFLLWIFTIIVSLSFLSGIAGAASTVYWWHVQKRTYENSSNDHNRLGFSVIVTGSSPEEYVTSDVVASVALWQNVTLGGPGSGTEITLPAHTFMTTKMMYGNYDDNTDAWNYDAAFHGENYFRVQYTTPDLAAGNYRLEVIFNDGSPPYTSDATFYGLQTLPTISANSFYGYEDASGNFVWGWKAPYSPTMYASGATNTSLRPSFMIFNGGTYIGEIHFKVGTQVPMMYIPKSRLDLAKALGDGYSVGLQIRSNDNNNRRYTNSINIDNLKQSNNTSKVVVIPLN